MNPPPPPPPPQNPPTSFTTDKDSQAQIFKVEAAKARNFLLGIAILYFIGNALPVIISDGTVVKISLSLIVTVLFIVTGILATTQPKISVLISAVVLGLVFILLLLVTVIGGFREPSLSTIIPWLIFITAVWLEVNAFKAAQIADRAKRQTA